MQTISRSSRWAILYFATVAVSSSQVTTATLLGVVTDPSGAAVPGATITLTHRETNASTVRSSDADGTFEFDFLRLGAYSVRVEARGFKRYDLRGLELAASQTIQRTFSLEIGAVSETVNVEAAIPQPSFLACRNI